MAKNAICFGYIFGIKLNEIRQNNMVRGGLRVYIYIHCFYLICPSVAKLCAGWVIGLTPVKSMSRHGYNLPIKFPKMITPIALTSDTTITHIFQSLRKFHSYCIWDFVSVDSYKMNFNSDIHIKVSLRNPWEALGNSSELLVGVSKNLSSYPLALIAPFLCVSNKNFVHFLNIFLYSTRKKHV